MISLKTKALEWIYYLYNQHSINDKEKVLMDCPLCFKLEGFTDEPMIYIQPTQKGLEFGFKGIKWHGHEPSPFMFKKHLLTWEDIEVVNKEEQQEAILNLLIKTINSRKRQYRKCQFCGEKVALEHRFNGDTCQGCASQHFDVVY